MTRMRKWLIMMMALLLLAGCSAPKADSAAPAGSAPAAAAKDETPTVWTKDEMPVKIDYTRMWEYGAAAQSDDPAVIAELVSAIQALKVGEKSEWVTDDYTDVLTFTFADGDTLRLEFENQCWVTGNGERYEVEGLGRVRAVLDGLVGDIE